MRTYNTILTELRPVLADVKGGDRDPAKIQKLRELTDEAHQAKSREQAEGDELLNALAGGMRSGPVEGGHLTRAGLKSTAAALATKAKGHAEQVQAKALTVGAYDAPLSSTAVAVEGHAQQGLVEALPLTVFPDRHIAYLRQNARALNASVVPEGQLKPTSTIGLERVADETKVIAHVSDPVDEMLLADVPSVAQVVGSELLYGLYTALEQQVLYGTGVGQLAGILAADGIQVVNTGARPIDRIRTAFTRLQIQGYTAQAIALHPADWEAIETTTTGSTAGTGDYILGGPVDVAAQKLWGARVVLTNSLNVGEAVVLDTEQVGIAHTGNISMHVGQPGDTFTRNQVVFRTEGRFQTMLRQPAGVVRVALASA